jgi:putative glutamine amidotransferase
LIWLAFGEPPDCGVKNARMALTACPKAAGILFTASRTALDDFCHDLRGSYGVGMRRPVIGICTALERASWSVWDQEAMLLPRSYVDAVQRAGGLALLLAPDPVAAEHPGQLLELIDGLMLAGGADIDPDSYGADRHAETDGTVPERDVFEIALARAAIAADLPVLGICRGMQLINVACGGTLLQHLPESFGHHEHRRVVGSFDGADHDVALNEGSLAAAAAGEVAHATKSHHHQGVDCLGAGLVVSGSSSFDELPEAIELPRHRFVLGVQWHPEADTQSNVISAFVAAARAAAAERADGSPDGRPPQPALEES